MKKIFCLAILAMTLSTPSFAAGIGTSETCAMVGEIAQMALQSAKKGVNKYEELANDPERIMSMSPNVALTILVVSQAMWDNRKTYSDAKAYKEGYRLCMEMK